MLQTRAFCQDIPHRQVMRVTTFQDLCAEWQPHLRWLVPVTNSAEIESLLRLRAAGVEIVAGMTGANGVHGIPTVTIGGDFTFQAGDVVAVTPERSHLQVLYRESDQHHTVFLTNRCNSNCVMCSQPPTRHDDSWLEEEAREVAAHIGRSPEVLGFTGGEPLLLGRTLRDILEHFHHRHPSTRFEILTNGRMFSDRSLAKQLLEGLDPSVCWMVPLYGHADFLHDGVVRATGAFDETIDGLLTLRGYRQAIQLRTVLIAPVLEVLPELCKFIARNLPFVNEVALMGCEPIGFALANRRECEIDVRGWGHQIEESIDSLLTAGLRPVIMNIPLCALPVSLWTYACRSISDWKQVYAAECSGCSVKNNCCGLFAWHVRGWRPSVIAPILEVT